MKNKILIITIIAVLAFAVSGCGAKEEAIEENNESNEIEASSEELSKAADEVKEAVKEIEDKVGTEAQSSNTVKCGQEYNAGDLSYNIISANIKNGVLRLNMEVFNNSGQDINFSPMNRLTVFNDNGEECSWNMMVGKLGGLITPNNKIVGETGFDIETESDGYVLHIGESYEFKPAIEIAGSDMGIEFDEIFEGGGMESEYTIGLSVESEGFDMLITGASVKSSDKEGQEIVLIELSMTNNDTESHALGFEIGGVYTNSGTALNTAVNDWTFRNYGVDSGETATGIVSYYCDAGEKDFYMVVKPNIKDFGRQETITFSVE